MGAVVPEIVFDGHAVDGQARCGNVDVAGGGIGMDESVVINLHRSPTLSAIYKSDDTIAHAPSRRRRRSPENVAVD